MRKRIQQQTLYKKQLSSQMQPVNASDTPLTVYDIFVNTPPTYTSGWAFIEFENTDTRDLIYFHDVVGNVLKYYKKDRDLLGNGAYLLTHTSGSSIQINTNGDWINYLSSNIDDFGLVQQWYVGSSALAVKVSGGFITFGTSSITVADVVVNLTPSVVNEIILDYSDNTVKAVVSLVGLNCVRLAQVVAGVSTITSIIDVREVTTKTVYNSTFFGTSAGAITINNLSIGTAQLADASVTTGKIVDASVTTAKIAPLAVGTAELNNGSVDTAKIANKAVTPDKIEDNPKFNDTFRLPELGSNPSLPVAGELKYFVKDLLGIPTAHTIDSDGVVTPLGVNPIIDPGSSVMVGPIAWTNGSNTALYNDPSALLVSSKITGFYVASGTIIGLVAECEVTADGQITFKSYNNSGVLQTETSVMFYYSIIY